MNWNNDQLAISVTVGKYTVQQHADGHIRALRNGEPWRDDLTGCKLTLEMAYEIDNLRRALRYYRTADFLTTEQQQVAESALANTKLTDAPTKGPSPER